MPRPDKPLSVLIVDDSSSVRAALAKGLMARGLDVLGGAADPYMARDLIYRLKPDVITLDLQMPGMDGLTFLGKLMAFHPLPVVVLSSLTSEKRELALQALELGAVEVFPKPDGASTAQNLDRLAEALFRAGSARLQTPPAAAPASPQSPGGTLDLQRVVAVGASTGGTQAIQALLGSLPALFPPLLIVQHMPAGFTQAFAKRLDRLGRIRVVEAEDGDLLAPGLALLAPGGMQMRLERHAGRLRVRCQEGAPVNHVAPSVDVLFHSVAEISQGRGIGVLLTGMGKDGAQGMLAMRQAGALTLAQNEASSAIWGMPREAWQLGAAEALLPLEAIGPRLVQSLAAALTTRGPL